MYKFYVAKYNNCFYLEHNSDREEDSVSDSSDNDEETLFAEDAEELSTWRTLNVPKSALKILKETSHLPFNDVRLLSYLLFLSQY